MLSFIHTAGHRAVLLNDQTYCNLQCDEDKLIINGVFLACSI